MIETVLLYLVLTGMMMLSTSLRRLVWLYLKLVSFLFIPIYIIRFFYRPKKLPPVTDPILLKPASVIADQIRKREISCETVVNAYISRVNAVNPIINAMVEDRFELALAEAKKNDEFLGTCGLSEDDLKEKYPLFGIPITIKSSLALTGSGHNTGLVIRKVQAPVDAVIVKHARDAGAIPILTSNTPELCLNWETTNKLIGTTRNPYNNTRTAGGSSGGETSFLGAGASLIGVGSDIAGSLRIPSHYCGVWGHKPSPNTVSLEGHYPDCRDRENWSKVFILGPLTRYATDLKFLLNIIMEPDMKDVLKLNELVEIKQIKIHYIMDVDSCLIEKTNQNTREALQDVITYFNKICDTKCSELKLPLMKNCAEISYLKLLDLNDVDNVFEGYGKGAYWELLKYFFCFSKVMFTSIAYGIFRSLYKHFPKSIINKVEKDVAELRYDIMDRLKEDGVLICPNNPTEARYHGDIYRKLFNPGWCSIFNSLGFPATSCPVRLTKDGLPIGIQVVAAPNCDRLTLAVAEELERAFGGWKAPNSNTNITEVLTK